MGIKVFLLQSQKKIVVIHKRKCEIIKYDFWS